MHYDAAGRVSQRDKASGVGAYYRYDAAGRVLQELRYPSADSIDYTYDARGATLGVQKTGVPEESWQYDAAGQTTYYRSLTPATVSPGLPGGLNSPGFVTPGYEHNLYYRYDEAGNRSAMAFLGGGVTGDRPRSHYTSYAYDARNLLASLTDPLGQTATYQRDALARETAKVLPNGVTTYHSYDAASEATGIVHQGPAGVLQSLGYTYDDAGRRTRIVREDGTRIYYSYDDANRLTGEDWLDPSDVHTYAFAGGAGIGCQESGISSRADGSVTLESRHVGPSADRPRGRETGAGADSRH